MSELITEKLSVGYDNKPLINEIELAVRAGKIVVLIGPNGAGKSTILKTTAGLLEPIVGTVFLNENSLKEVSLSDRAKNIAVMMTGRPAEEYMTVKDVVAGGRYPHTGLLGKLGKGDEKIISDVLTTVGAAELIDSEFNKLSDGQKQRVLLARALAQEPGIMILDEPTGFLDIGYKLSFLETLKKLAQEKGIGILMSMHELELAERIADVVVCISSDGRIDKIGSTAEVFTAQYIEKLFDVPAGLLSKTYRFARPSNPVAQVEDRLGESKTHFLMVQGTMSNAGKSLIVAGLCRIFKQDGYRVAPFKSQNMALNSYITEDGLEMGRAQVMQAEAAGIKPSVYMNPILLKPNSETGSQVIVNGKVRGNMRAREYFKYKTELVPDILDAVRELEKQADIIVIEGAGSPAEINLKTNDIVNMGMAKMVDAPVLLVGDIDRGGVFAQLLGTIELLEDEERDRIKGLIVNKFRGDKTILDPGLEMLEERGGIPVAGVVPYMQLQLEDEDSLSDKFERRKEGLLTVGIVKLPHISNFTDFDVFEQVDELAVHYITGPSDVVKADCLIIPGSKNTIADMKWLKESGLEAVIQKYAAAGNPVIGICGGYQILGERISDPLGVECGGEITGLGLLKVETVLSGEKHTSQVKGNFSKNTGFLASLSDLEYEGYEIHMGETKPVETKTAETKPTETKLTETKLTETKTEDNLVIESTDDKLSCNDKTLQEFTAKESGYCAGNVYGTYVHGVFDRAEITKALVEALATRKGIDLSLDRVVDYKALKEQEYDKLAATMREYMDMELVYRMIGVMRND